MKTNIFLFTLLVCSIVSGRAQTANIPATRDHSAFGDGTTMMPQVSLDLSGNHTGLIEKINGGHFTIEFNCGELFNLYSVNAFDASSTFTVVLEDASNNILFSKTGVVLQVSEKDAKAVYSLAMKNFPDADEIIITQTAYTESLNDGAGYFRDKAEMKFAADLELAVDIKDASGTKLSVPTDPLSNATITNRLQTFYWGGCNISTANPTKNFSNYQFELLKLEDNGDIIPTPQSIKSTIDWSKALRVNTPECSLKMTIGEGTGFYVYRVRPVGGMFPGGAGNKDNLGEWSLHPADGSTVTVNMSSIQGSTTNGIPYFYFEDPNEDMNWSFQRTFSENGKSSENMTYAGGLLSPKQTQTRLSSNGTKIVSESFQDYSGRPGVNAMPVPVTGEDLEYNPSFVHDDGGAPYNAKNFDVDNKIGTPDLIRQDPGDAHDYYSNNNADLSIPKADGYPYTRSIYFTDGTNAVKEQSGVGLAHSIGAQSNDQGRTTRHLFQPATEEELVRIFGVEAPSAEDVFKTITIDPNNTVSVTYTSKEGHVIATALGQSQGDPLAEPSGQTPQNQKTTQRLSGGTVIDDIIIETRRFSLTQTINEPDIVYTPDCNTSPGGCGGGEICKSFATIRVKNVSTGMIYKSSKINVGTGCTTGSINLHNATDWKYDASGDGIANTAYALNGNGRFELPAGSYIIEKRIEVGGLATALDAENSKLNGQITPLTEHIKKRLSSVVDNASMQVYYSQMQALEDALVIAKSDLSNGSWGNFTSNADYSEFAVLKYPANATEIGDLDFDFTPSNGSEPSSFTMSAGCCNNLGTSVGNKPVFDCISPIKDFEQLLRDLYTEYDMANNTDYVIYEPAWGNKKALLPGFTQSPKGGKAVGSFNMLANRMIDDAYDCGDGKTIARYECKDLWECWYAVVNPLKKIADAMPQGDVHPAGGQDAQNDGDQSVMDDDVNQKSEDSAEEQGGAIVNWIAQRAMSKRMRDDVQGEQAELNLAKEFMECAGYNFADIVHSKTAPFEDSNGDPITGYVATNNARDSDGKLWMPYIHDQTYAYKYFYYNHENDDWTDTERSWPNTERTYCYEVSPCNTPCNNPCAGASYHDSWDCGQRAEFYQTIKNRTAPRGADYSDFRASAGDCPDPQEVQDMQDRYKARMLGVCSDKAEDIRQNLVSVLADMCITIGNCPSPNEITSEELESMVNAVISSCQAEVNQRFDDFGTPECNLQVCDYEIENSLCHEISKVDITLIDEVNKVWMNQLKTFRFSIDPATLVVREQNGDLFAFPTPCTGATTPTWTGFSASAEPDNEMLNLSGQGNNTTPFTAETNNRP